MNFHFIHRVSKDTFSHFMWYVTKLIFVSEDNYVKCHKISWIFDRRCCLWVQVSLSIRNVQTLGMEYASSQEQRLTQMDLHAQTSLPKAPYHINGLPRGNTILRNNPVTSRTQPYLCLTCYHMLRHGSHRGFTPIGFSWIVFFGNIGSTAPSATSIHGSFRMAITR